MIKALSSFLPRSCRLFPHSRFEEFCTWTLMQIVFCSLFLIYFFLLGFLPCTRLCCMVIVHSTLCMLDLPFRATYVLLDEMDIMEEYRLVRSINGLAINSPHTAFA